PDAGRVDDAARPQSMARAGLGIGRLEAVDPVAIARQGLDPAMVQYTGALCNRGPRESERQPRIIEYAVPIGDGARQGVGANAGNRRDGAVPAEEARAPEPGPARQHVVDDRPGAVEPLVEPAAPRAIHGHDELQGL